MAARLLIIDGNSLLKLLIHYTNESYRPDANDTDKIPLDAELESVGKSVYLPRWLGMRVRSAQWPDHPDPRLGGEYWPIHIRYEGGRIMRWSNNDRDLGQQWTYEFEKPKRR